MPLETTWANVRNENTAKQTVAPNQRIFSNPSHIIFIILPFHYVKGSAGF